MISHPKFIQTHLHLQSPKLLLQTDGSPVSFASIDSVNPNPYGKVLHCPCEDPSAYFQPLCSSDGLILVHVRIEFDGTRSGKSFILWNPSNRSHRRISCPYELPFLTSLYGLCYDSTADDYRVFIVSHEKVTSVAVYGLRNNSWDIFVDNRYRHYVSEHWAAVVNGAVYWVMFSMESGLWVIVYFDLVEGKFKEVPPPSSWKEDDVMNLVVLGDSFACILMLVKSRLRSMQ